MWSTSNKLLRWRIIQTKTTFFSRNPVIVEVAEFARLWGNWSGGLVSRGAARAILPIRKITLGLLGTCCRFHPNKIKQIRDIVIVVLYGETKQSIRGSGKRDYRQLSACNGIPAYDRSSLIFCSLLVLISAATGSAKDRDRSWDIRGGRRLLARCRDDGYTVLARLEVGETAAMEFRETMSRSFYTYPAHKYHNPVRTLNRIESDLYRSRDWICFFSLAVRPVVLTKQWGNGPCFVFLGPCIWLMVLKELRPMDSTVTTAWAVGPLAMVPWSGRLDRAKRAM
jgi:hypothetical protein